MLPVQNTIVRFELDGLGDPFYKLLGYDLNTIYDNGRSVSQALECGSAGSTELQDKLNAAWEGYGVQGAALVYIWNPRSWPKIVSAPLIPSRNPNPFNAARSQNNDEESFEDVPEPPKPSFTCLRALDLQLVINVLGRARSQLLLADAPLVFSQQYLNRSILTDAPHLVRLARATGYIQEKL